MLSDKGRAVFRPLICRKSALFCSVPHRQRQTAGNMAALHGVSRWSGVIFIGKGGKSGLSSRRRRLGTVPVSLGGLVCIPSPRPPGRDSIFFLVSGMVGAKEIA